MLCQPYGKRWHNAGTIDGMSKKQIPTRLNHVRLLTQGVGGLLSLILLIFSDLDVDKNRGVG